MFTYIDLLVLGEYVAAAWERGVDRDWSAPAGTLDWSCTKAAEHAYDATLAVGYFLASRRRDRYPDWCNEFAVGNPPWPAQLVEAIAVAGRLVAGIVATSPEDVRAIIWRRPEPAVAPPSDFAPRAALETVLHGHDVAAGLAVPFEPPAGPLARLRDHTRAWPLWSGRWGSPARTNDPWQDLLHASGRKRFMAH